MKKSLLSIPYNFNEYQYINNTPFVIRRATLGDKERIIDYVFKSRNELYPMLPSKIPEDLKEFEHFFLNDNKSIMIIAIDKRNNIIGTIGYIPYNNRFQSFKISNAAEVIRLYTTEKFRRHGLGSKILNLTTLEAKNAGYKTLYLHTHPFLNGALQFWQKNSFNIITIDKSEFIETIHMKKNINNANAI